MKKFLKSKSFISFQVTPSNDRSVTYDDESWKPSEEEVIKDKKDLSRSNEVRQSKTKLKKYFKKCKNVLGSSKSASLDVSYCDDNVSTSSSWYIENQIVDNLNRCEINELEEIFEVPQINLDLNEGRSVYQVASIVEVRGPSTTEGSASDSGSDKKEAEGGSSQQDTQKENETEESSETNSPVLTESQDEDDVEVSDKQEEGEENETVPTVSAFCLIEPSSHLYSLFLHARILSAIAVIG